MAAAIFQGSEARRISQGVRAHRSEGSARMTSETPSALAKWIQVDTLDDDHH